MAERNRTLSMVRNGPRPLVAKALRDRARNGPDGGGASRYRPIVAVGVRYPCTDGEALERDPTASVGAMGRRRSGRTRVPVGHPGGSNSGLASPTCPFLPLICPFHSAPSIRPFNPPLQFLPAPSIWQ